MITSLLLVALPSVACPQEAAGLQALEPLQAQAAPPAERNVDSLFEGALVGARDGQDFSETPSYRHLLELVARYREQELRDGVQRELDSADALAHPDAWRGEIVHVRGLLAGMEAVRLAAPLAGEVDVYRAFVTETDASEGVVVDFLGAPPTLEIQRDVVDIEGVFFRTVRYENRRDARTEAPYLIARGLRILDEEALPRQTFLDEIGKLLVGAALVFFVVRIVVSVRGARPRRRHEQSRRFKAPQPRESHS